MPGIGVVRAPQRRDPQVRRVPRVVDEILSKQRLPANAEIFPIQVLPKPVSGVHNARPANEVVGGAERQGALKKDVAVS